MASARNQPQAPNHPLPASYTPQLATLVKHAPAGDAWAHEIKFDGYRIGCRIDRGDVRLISRRGNDWTTSFPEMCAAARALGMRRALLDGEVAIVLPDGRTSFQALQNAVGLLSGSDVPRRARRVERPDLVYFVFDLLHLDGQDVAREPLDERKRRLARLIGAAGQGDDVEGARGVIRYAQHIVGGGPAFFREACRVGLEGIVSKRRDAAYRPGRNDAWVKTKCVKRQELVVGGFTDPAASRDGIGSLLVGVHDRSGALRYAGKVGTGFSRATSGELRRRLDAIEQRSCPFSPAPAGSLGSGPHWVRPELVVEAVFTEWTEDGKVRHASFQGVRPDLRPQDVVREEPVSETAGAPFDPGPPSDSGIAPRAPRAPRVPDAPRTLPRPPRRRAAQPSARPTRPRPSSSTARNDTTRARPEVAGVPLSHADRVFFPDIGVTKLDLARFYASIADWIMPHLIGRPLTLYRCPGPIGRDCYFMKHSKVWSPPALRRVRIQEKTKLGEYLVADSIEALVSLVQMDIVEVHTWNSRADDVERPDRIVLDLDPGPEVAWREVVAAAHLTRRVFRSLGLESFVKLTGGSGLHVVVPVVAERDWSECFDFSRALAEAIGRQRPALYTTRLAKAGREKKILIDYLRNNRTNTSVAAYSTRARPGAPVSTPLAWDELSARMRPDRFHVRNLRGRLDRLREDPWHAYWTTRQQLRAEAIEAVASL